MFTDHLVGHIVTPQLRKLIATPLSGACVACWSCAQAVWFRIMQLILLYSLNFTISSLEWVATTALSFLYSLKADHFYSSLEMSWPPDMFGMPLGGTFQYPTNFAVRGVFLSSSTAPSMRRCPFDLQWGFCCSVPFGGTWTTWLIWKVSFQSRSDQGGLSSLVQAYHTASAVSQNGLSVMRRQGTVSSEPCSVTAW